jgi:hypothetical protein
MAQEPEGSSPHSQQPATGPCPEPVESNPHAPQPISQISIIIPSSHLRLTLPKYKNLSVEIQRMWNIKCTVILVIIGAMGIVSKSLKKIWKK